MGLQRRNPFENDEIDDLPVVDADGEPLDDPPDAVSEVEAAMLAADEEPVVLGPIHHIGIAVADLDEALAQHRSWFGATVIDRGEIFEEAIDAALVDTGSSRILLQAATSDESWIAEFLDDQPSGLTHVGYEVDDLAATLESLRGAGWELIDDRPRHGLDGHLIANAYPPDQPGTIIQFVQLT